MYTIKAHYNDQGKRTGWAIWWNGREIVDVWPTKRQAKAWIDKASDK